MKQKAVKKSNDPLVRKRLFIRALAEYLCDNAATKSIQLEMQVPSAVEWAKVRNESPVFGNVGVDEAEKTLLEYFGVSA
jgi:hypothetical protein